MSEQSPNPSASGESPIILQHPLLKGHYTVMEVATLAAHCEGKSDPHKIDAAISLLLTTEIFARTPGEALLSQQWSRDGMSKSDGESAKYIAYKRGVDARWRKIQKLMNDASRVHGKIDRSALALSACRMVGRDVEAATANKRYNQFLGDDFKAEADYLESCGIKVKTLEDYRALFETGHKTKVFLGDNQARQIMYRFLEWLETKLERIK
jgi:hypothetical protein